MKSPPCPLSASHPHCRQQHYFGWAFSAVGRRSPGRRGTGTYVRCWPTWTWDACVQTNRANKEERHCCGWLGGKNRPINQFYLKFILTLAAATTTTTKEKQALVDFGEESSQEQAFLCVVVGDFYGFLFFKWRFFGRWKSSAFRGIVCERLYYRYAGEDLYVRSTEWEIVSPPRLTTSK